MEKYLIFIEELKPGMQIAQDIYNESGTIILSEHTILNENMIRKLHQLSYSELYVYIDSEQIDSIKTVANQTHIEKNSVKKSFEEAKKNYVENVKNIKDIIKDFYLNETIDIKKVDNIKSDILNSGMDSRDILLCINEVKDIDEYTYSHSVNVAFLARLLANWLNFDSEKSSRLVQSALLHDIGKLKVPPEILNKPAKLTDSEFEIMKRHSLYGYEALKKTPGLSDDVLNGVLMHHEREDGSGYPNGLKSHQIHEFGKIIAILDIFDAMTSKRVYKDRKCPFNVFSYFENDLIGVLDLKFLSIFLQNISSFFMGDTVLLSDNSVGEIVFLNPTSISKPIIKVDEQFIDLSKQNKLKIVDILKKY